MLKGILGWLRRGNGHDDADEFRRLNERKARREPERGLDQARANYFLKHRQIDSAIEALKEELRYFPDNTAAAELLTSLQSQKTSGLPTADAEFNELYRAVQPYTMLSEARLASLARHAREICENGLPGNFVECGVAAGGSSALLAAMIARHSQQPRHLFSCDTFEGMPAATAEDVYRGKHAEETGWGAGTCAAPIDSLKEVCGKLGVEQLVQPVRGLFADTLPRHREEFGPIALLHMDGDWYESTRDILRNLYDQVVPGGRIQIDDYGYWEGCRKAMSEFCDEHKLVWDLQPIDGTGVWLRKPGA